MNTDASGPTLGEADGKWSRRPRNTQSLTRQPTRAGTGAQAEHEVALTHGAPESEMLQNV